MHISNENQKLILHNQGGKKTNLVSETTIRKNIIETCVKKTTSERGNLDLQNLQDRLSWFLSSKTKSVIPAPSLPAQSK